MLVDTSMKNHWIEIHQRKGQSWWTAEFHNYSSLVLPARVAELVDDRPLRCGCGQIHLTFNVHGADKQLFQFLAGAKASKMSSYYASLHRYQGVFPVAIELENYELFDLSFQSLCAITVTSIVLVFDFGTATHYTSP